MTPAERVNVVDILRGFAIFGILLVNMSGFKSPIHSELVHQWTGSLDRAATWFIEMFADGKFYPLFSFLFGWGSSIQMLRAESRGADFVQFYRRRLLALLLIGLIHAFLIWEGDVLVSYALLGFLLILFRSRSDKTLVASAAISMSLVILLWGTMIERYHDWLYGLLVGRDLDLKAIAVDALRIYSRGTVAEILTKRVQIWADFHAFLPFGALDTFAYFLLGLYVGRRKIFQNPSPHLPFFRRAVWWGLSVGLVGNLPGVQSGYGISGPGAPESYLRNVGDNLVWTVGHPALTLFYISAIVLLAQSEALKKRLALIAAVGRMALSNYLLQSLICTTIFYSYGLGLYGKVGPAVGLLLTIVIYSLQIPLSVWWLRRFRFGPMEWVWRSLTYAKMQPMLAEPITATPSLGSGSQEA